MNKSNITTEYSVILQCCDPPVPVLHCCYNNVLTAFRKYHKLVETEIKMGGGGEFTISLYKHNVKRPLWELYTDKDEDNNEFVHSIYFNEIETEELYSFDYMLLGKIKN